MICPNCKFTGNPPNSKYCGKCGSKLDDHIDSLAGVLSSSVASANKKEYITIGRNDMCPCGSGKKYKNCHGRNY